MRRAALRAVGAFGAAALVAAVPATVTAGSPTSTTANRIPSGKVIVLLKDQHAGLAAKGAKSPRAVANRAAAVSAIATAQASGARDLHPYSVISAFSATLSQSQADALAANPSVAAIYPDLQVREAPRQESEQPGSTTSAAPSAPENEICPSDPATPLLEPEALQLTNTAFRDPSIPQAQNLVDGTGVKVGYIADGIDVDNPDFIRADGSHVFGDYQDFSGDGPNAPTAGAEAFGDASSIAAQGRQTYDLSQFVNPAHPLPPGCNIRIRGVAPGSTLYGYKVYSGSGFTTTSAIVQAIDFAVNIDHVDVLNESFAANPYPDNGTDPITLADEAAVAAGVTVVSGTGDAGQTGTIGSPSSSGAIVSVAASTSFRSYAQTTNAGFQLSNGSYLSDQISALSSGGITQNAGVPDLSAPGDLGWALCSTDTATYAECSGNGGQPSNIQNFGGTSQASPFTAGAAALVIEAYRTTHAGVTPAPALVKRLLTSTADDLGHPAYEQGAGRLDTLAAVQAAESWQDANGSPAPQGDALVVDQSQLSLVGNPGANAKGSLAVTNTADHAQTVTGSLRVLGDPTTVGSGDAPLNTATAPTFLDAFGIARSYVEVHFDVAAGHDLLAVSTAAQIDPAASPIILLDPNGVYSAYSIPQGAGNFSHVDVSAPVAGTWTAIFGASRSPGFNGAVHWLATTQDWTTAPGKLKPSHAVLQPGQSMTFKVTATEPSQPGDVSASLQLASNGGHVTSVPVTERAVVPAGATTFSGVITGGNGRPGAPAQSNVYYLKLASHQKLLRIHVQLSDPSEIVYATLVGPDGQTASFQTSLADNGSNLVFTPDIWIHHANPTAGPLDPRARAAEPGERHGGAAAVQRDRGLRHRRGDGSAAARQAGGGCADHGAGADHEHHEPAARLRRRPAADHARRRAAAEPRREPAAVAAAAQAGTRPRRSSSHRTRTRSP